MKATIDKILERTLVVFLMVLIINILWQVISRYVMASPSSFTDELSRILLVWTGLLAAAYGSGKNIHLAIDLISGKLSKKWNDRLIKLPYIIVGLFALLVFIVGGIALVLIIASLKQTTPALGLPVWLIYLAVPFSGLIILYYNFYHFTHTKKELE